jgi:hypothetical protein
VGIDEMITAYAMVGIHLTKAAALELVAEVDADGSGEIEFDEFRWVTTSQQDDSSDCSHRRKQDCSWLVSIHDVLCSKRHAVPVSASASVAVSVSTAGGPSLQHTTHRPS